METNALQAKLIEYAYPSSITAEKAGHGKIGCFFVKIYADDSTLLGGKHIGGFYPSIDDAIAYADSLEQPFHKAHYKYPVHPKLINH